MHKYIHIPFVRLRVGRFIFLLASIILMFTVRPFLEGFVKIGLLVDIFATLILVSAIYAGATSDGRNWLAAPWASEGISGTRRQHTFAQSCTGRSGAVKGMAVQAPNRGVRRG